MPVWEMRKCLMHYTKYSGAWKWRTKVKNMGDNQVLAVYRRMSEAGEILKHKVA